MDLEGHFTYVSPSVFQLSGYTPDEALKQSIVEALTPDSARIVLEDLQRFWETGTLPSNYYELGTSLVRMAQLFGPKLIFLCFETEMENPKPSSERAGTLLSAKKLRKVLRKSEAKYRELADSLRNVFETDLTGKITFFSQRAIEVSGFTREELEKGLNLLSFVVPEEREMADG